MEQRVCKKCGETKDIDQFAKVYSLKNRGKDYFQHRWLLWFRAFSAEKERRRRREKPEEYRLARRRHRNNNLEHCRELRRKHGRKIKDQAYLNYGGYKCVCCGEVEQTMLTIDHINNDGNKHRNLLNGGRGRKASVDLYHWLKKNNYPDGFQVLCYNCNMSKHRNKGICSHKLREGSSTREKSRTAKQPEVQSIPLG